MRAFFRSLQTVIFLPFLIVTLAVLVVSAASWYTLSDSFARTTVQLQKTVQMERLLTQLSGMRSSVVFGAINFSHTAIHKEAQNPGDKAKLQVERAFNSVAQKRNLENYQSFLLGLEKSPVIQYPEVSALVSHAKQAASDGLQVVAAIMANATPAEIDRLQRIWSGSELQVDAVLSDLLATNQHNLSREQANLLHIEHHFIQWIIGLLVLILCSFVVKYFMIRHYVLSPLQFFDNKVQTILRSGRLEALSLNNATEIGRLGNAFDQLMDRVISDERGLQQEIVERTRAENQTRQALNDLQIAKDHLVRSEKLVAVGTMVGGVAHEINNPLMGLMGYLEQLKRTAQTEQDKTLVIKARNQVDRIERIVKSMLIFARSSNRPDSVGEGAEISRCLDLILDLVEPPRKTANVMIHVEIPEGLPHAAIGSDPLQQILLNLIKNSVDALEHGSADGTEPSIWIEAKQAGQEVVITVADNGPGVPPDVEHRLFEPFFTTKEPGKGTGLGLPVSLQLAEMAGGSIMYKAREHGGAVFSLHVPKVVE